MPSEGQAIGSTVPSCEMSHERLQKEENVPINRLPPEILIQIFGFYCQDANSRSRGRQCEWHRLFHVCSRWREIITWESRYLDLRLLCTNGTPVEDSLHCWPDLPIVMRYRISTGSNLLATGDEDAIVAVLRKPGRIHTIQLPVTKSLLGKLATITEGPFTSMELLELSSQSETELVLPDLFLCGEAPRLHTIRTTHIAFPALPQLLLSAKKLVSLQLEAIPSAGCIPPGLLITTLSEMVSLQMFHIHFLSPTSHSVLNPEECPPYSPTSVKLPVLKYLEFYGDYQYLEYLLAGIDAPVKYIYITFFYDPDFCTSQLQRFITRLDKWHAFPNQATLCYSKTGISITFDQLESPLRLGLRISCRQFAGQMESLAEIYGQPLHATLPFAVRQLNIYSSSPLPDEHDNPDLSPFVDLLRRFNDLESLCVTKETGSHVARALVENMVLPRVREIYLEEHDVFASARNALAPFITARQRDNRAVTLIPWKPNNDHHPSSNRPRTRPTRISTSFTDRNDPALMLEEDIQEMCERCGHHPHTFAIQSLYQRTQFLLLSFIRNRQVKLDNVIEIASDLLQMHPKQMRQLKLFRTLAFCFALGNQKDESVSMFKGAFQDESATTSERLNMAWWWATLARAWEHSSTALAYQNTLSALQSSLTGTFTVQLQPVIIGRLGSKIQIPLEYASYRIQIGQLELAVETIEQGRTLIWSEIYGLWPFIGGLRRVNPDLADQLATVSEELAADNSSILTHRVGVPRLNEEEHEDHDHMDDFGPMFNKRRRLLRKRQDVIAAIKHLPGFENFMEPIPFRTLQHAASRGPVIIINHCPWRCDILIILRNSPPSHIPTTDGFYERANILASALLKSRKQYGVASEPYEQELRSVLKELHERVGQPVINKLRELGVPEQSRVWWYPTSVFCSLPLHAMGPVPPTDGRDRYFSDLYICSYTPSLNALIAAATPVSDPRPTLLFVGRPIDSLLSASDMKVMRSIGVRETRLVFGNTTRNVVINGLQTHGLTHFAYGSHRKAGKPFDTALELDDGDRLALFDLIRAQVPAAELAVLAASATAEVVDGTDFVEGLNLAAAMQYYGFGSIVGTMWDFGDGGAEDLSVDFYKQMVSGGAGDTASLAKRSAGALQYAVQRLREGGVTLQRWVNWVHYGA